MLFQRHFAVFVGAAICFICHAKTNKTSTSHFERTSGKTNISEIKWMKTDNENATHSIINYNSSLVVNAKKLNTSVSESETTTMHKRSTLSTTQAIPPSTSVISNSSDKIHTKNTWIETTSSHRAEKYQTGILICIIIIAVLVLVCAVLIIVSVALANKVSSLKAKLTQSKRQARSNGDFLSASSILWPSGLETLQKTTKLANLTMDEISLGDTINTQEEKHQLMPATKEDDPKHTDEVKDKSSLQTDFMVEI